MGYKQHESDEDATIFNGTPKESIDWNEDGMVTPVKNQGACGSCWAFASVAAIESRYAITEKHTEILKWSEQELVDCVDACGGCRGGHMIPAFDFTALEDLFSEELYAYEGKDLSCRINDHTDDEPHMKTRSYGRVKRISPEDMKLAIEEGPVAVGVDASNWSTYRSGIFNNCNKRKNHAVLAVGYTSEYWLIKNSWGKNWGEAGYIRLEAGNTCGFLEDGVFPTML